MHATYHGSQCAVKLSSWGTQYEGGLAQLAERVLSMHEVWGLIPQFSNEKPRCVTIMTRGKGVGSGKCW